MATNAPPVFAPNVMQRWVEFVLYRAYAGFRVEAERYYIGWLWWIAEPAIEMAVYYVVFGMILARYAGDFALMLLCGLIAWRWFYSAINGGARSILANQGLANQVAMPKLAFPFVSVLVNTAKFVLVLALLLILLPLAGRYPSSAYVWLPALFVVQLTLVTAGVVVAAALVPLVPSLQIIINTGLRVAMFLSGVFFSAEQVPAHLQPWLKLNPMFVLIESWRAVLLHGRAPDVGPLAAVLLFSLAGLWLGERIIRRHEFEYPRLSP